MATSQGTWEDSAGLSVNAHFGPRGTDDAGGQVKTAGTIQELRFVLDGTMLSNQTLPLTRQTIPAGSKVIDVTLDVNEVFVIGGTTPTLDIGTDGSEGTNGVDFSEAELEATGITVETTRAGTWNAELAAETTVNIALGGTTPTSTSAGSATVIIRYRKQ